jgi:hypothetical protein
MVPRANNSFEPITKTTWACKSISVSDLPLTSRCFSINLVQFNPVSTEPMIFVIPTTIARMMKVGQP